MNSQLEQRSEAKWGEAAWGGFQILPDILLKKQGELGLTPTEMLVLINVTMHWWYVDQRPFPRTTTIAARMGTDQRTVQRVLRRLKDLKLVERVKERAEDGKDRIVCDLSGLIARLNQLVTTDKDYAVRAYRRNMRELQSGSIEADL